MGVRVLPGARMQLCVMKTISLVIPCYNEEDALGPFWESITPIARRLSTMRWEFVFVDDGSTDATAALIEHRIQKEKKHTIRLVRLSRNFGKEPALVAGLHHTTGDAVIPCDIDLQDPPDIIPHMVKKWQQGAETVIGIRSDRSADSWFKRVSAQFFYAIMKRIAHVPIQPNAGDFRLLDQKVVTAIRSLNEHTIFMKGIFAWAGFKQQFITYTRAKRSKGRSKFNLAALIKEATDGIVSFSIAPLRLWMYVGMLIAIIAAVCGAAMLAIDVSVFNLSTDTSTLLFSIFFMGGLQLFVLGVIGEYAAHTLIESKKRPPYIIAAVHDNRQTSKPHRTKRRTR